MHYPRLFEPCQVANLQLKNRIVVPPMSTNYADNGFVTDRQIGYYTERARGGVGMIVVEDAIVESPRGHHTLCPLRIDDDMFIPGLRRLAKAIKDNDAVAALQLNHAGRRAVIRGMTTGRCDDTRQRAPVAPSSLADPGVGFMVPRALAVEEIGEIVEKFAEAARRARDAGFDAISLHCAHMYLVSEFLSPLSNRRRDEYGGDLEGRLRFALEIISRTKELVGSDYPFMCRMNGVEPVAGGLTEEEARQIASRFEQAGLHAIHVSVGGAGLVPGRGWVSAIGSMRVSPGTNAYLSEGIKKLVSIPVTVANRINDPRIAEEILAQNQADLICVGRGVIADPQWAQKAQQGRVEEIRKCIACGCCSQNVGEIGVPLECAVNAVAGKEEEYGLAPTARSKRVVVIGGGPAGMEAARVAALRGHHVHLYERTSRLGGQLLLAAIPPGKDEIPGLIRYLETQIKKLGVNAELGREASTDSILEEKPEAVILASGAAPFKPRIPGVNGDNVALATEVLHGKQEVPQRVVIVGGGRAGLEVAEYLAIQRKDVAVVEMQDQVGTDIPGIARQGLMASLGAHGVKIMVLTRAEQVTEKGLVVTRRRQRELLEADIIVLAVGAKPNDELESSLRKRVAEVYSIGDCCAPSNIMNAIHQGFKTAMKI